jgi:hypothetical protein
MELLIVNYNHNFPALFSRNKLLSSLLKWVRPLTGGHYGCHPQPTKLTDQSQDGRPSACGEVAVDKLLGSGA